jgi:hypothetical protein
VLNPYHLSWVLRFQSIDLIAMRRFLLITLSWVLEVLAETCTVVDVAYPSIEVAYPSSSAFSQSQSDYWNKASWYMTPTCILYPQNARDVARIVDILGTNNERFAIKGGGHMPNVLFNEYVLLRNFPLVMGKETLREYTQLIIWK